MKRKIGRIDVADFPRLGAMGVEVKIDTGAYTSAIHCTDVRVEDNYLICRFWNMDGSDFDPKEIVFDEYDVKVIKSSNGQTQARYRICTEIVLFNKTYPIYFTLSDREEMKYPVLLGRKFLTKKFVVDINKTDLSYKHRIREAKKQSS